MVQGDAIINSTFEVIFRKGTSKLSQYHKIKITIGAINPANANKLAKKKLIKTFGEDVVTEYEVEETVLIV